MRGVIARGLGNRYSKPKAIFFTAILFGFIHLNIWQFAHCICRWAFPNVALFNHRFAIFSHFCSCSTQWSQLSRRVAGMVYPWL